MEEGAGRAARVGSPVAAAGTRKDTQAAEGTAGTDTASTKDAKDAADGAGAYEDDVAAVEAAGADASGGSGDVETEGTSAPEAQTEQHWTLRPWSPISGHGINHRPNSVRRTYVLQLGQNVVVDAKLLKLALDVGHDLVDDGPVDLGLAYSFSSHMRFSRVTYHNSVRHYNSWLLYLSRLSAADRPRLGFRHHV